jgi:hypothetical protein
MIGLGRLGQPLSDGQLECESQRHPQGIEAGAEVGR